MTQTARDQAEAQKYPHVVRFVRETPWAILESKLYEITELIALRASGIELTDEEIQARIGAGPARRRAYVADGGVAVIPVYGVITPRADMFSQISGGTSVQGLQAALREALTDSKVNGILLDIDSPGGSVDMVTELAAEIRAARKQKPVLAIANTMAGSAAYWLGAQASSVSVTPSGNVGSIGVIAMHDDISVLQEKLGVKTTLITAGKYKGELSPLAPLSDEARERVQGEVDRFYAMFTQDVAYGRGVGVDAVRDGFGQGRMLLARDAVAAGMADQVETYDQALERLDGGDVARGGRTRAAVGDDVAVTAGPIAPHSTATVDTTWDGPAMKANLRNDGGEAYLRSAYAWQDDSAPADQTGSYKFIHHMVSGDGDVGAANMTACSTGIGILNGGRSGTTIPDGDRKGVYNHLAKHLRDGGKEPPPLTSLTDETTDEAAESGLSFAQQAEALHASAEALRERTASLAEVERGHLTVTKRDRLSACTEALRETTTALEGLLAATNPSMHADALLRERLRFERSRADL